MIEINQDPLSVILPTLNEEESIVLIIEKIINVISKKVSVEIIIVDDISEDATLARVRKFQASSKNENVSIIIVKNQKQLGLGGSILAGIITASNDIVVVMDSDLTHPPEDIPKLVKYCEQNSLVIGSRYVRGGFMETRHLYVASKIYNEFLRRILGLKTKDLLGGFFVFKKSHLAKYLRSEIFSGYGDYFVWLIFGIEKYSKLPFTEIPVTFAERYGGKSKSKRFSMLISYLVSSIRCKKFYEELNSF